MQNIGQKSNIHLMITVYYRIRTLLKGIIMLFPDAKRVIFHKNPLDEALCQFRFPQNLSIETEVPSKFQDVIKEDYPLFNEKVEIQVKFSESPDNKISEMVDFQPSSIKNKNYEFISADEKWKINLTSGFLSLSTIDYSRWEFFSEHLKKPFTALLSIYNPQFFTRIGLRYRDIIRRSRLRPRSQPLGRVITALHSWSINGIKH